MRWLRHKHRWRLVHPVEWPPVLGCRCGERWSATIEYGDPIACEWCGTALMRIAGHDGWVWIAVKGKERGYNPVTCAASDDGRHSPDEADR